MEEVTMPKWFKKTGRHCSAAKRIWNHCHGSYPNKYDKEKKKWVPRGNRTGFRYNKDLTKYAIVKYHRLYRAGRIHPQKARERQEKKKKASKAVVDADED
jgi:hypothetical protein